MTDCTEIVLCVLIQASRQRDHDACPLRIFVCRGAIVPPFFVGGVLVWLIPLTSERPLGYLDYSDYLEISECF